VARPTVLAERFSYSHWLVIAALRFPFGRFCHLPHKTVMGRLQGAQSQMQIVNQHTSRTSLLLVNRAGTSAIADANVPNHSSTI